MIGFACQRLMELEVEVRTGAPYGEKSGERAVAQPPAEVRRPRRPGPLETLPTSRGYLITSQKIPATDTKPNVKTTVLT